MPKEIIINHTHHETRVAMIEDGVLTELQYEREREQRIVGNIYKGRIVKVLPGMEAAFIDIGAERAAFLHIDDVVLDEDLNDNGKRNLRKEKQPIEKLLKEGNSILVQVSKGPISQPNPAHIAASILYISFDISGTLFETYENITANIFL